MTGAAPARRAAYAILRAVTTCRSDLPDAVARARDLLPDHRDQALANEIASGTLRWMGALDQVIAVFAGRPASRLDPEILDVLRLGAYQLLHLDRVPARAVVHDSVELARESGKRSAAGLANAVLRRIDREKLSLPLPTRPDPGDRAAALDYLSQTLSHPRWLSERWLARVGFEAAETWERFNNSPAQLTLRANTLRIGRDDLAARLGAMDVAVAPTRFAPDGLLVTAGHPLRSPLAEEGWFFVQDEASQLVALAANAQPGERVLDVSAAPGGKTLAMASDMRDRGILVASDLRPARVRLLRETVARGGVTSVRIARLDATNRLPFGPVFDCVLLDAPCSGLGTIRRDPEVRWRRTPGDLPRLALTQSVMLAQGARVVRPGGRLVYATCSSEPEENEEVAARFLSTNAGFELESPAAGSGRTSALAPVVDGSGFLRTRPDLHGLDAFFVAVMRRRG